MNSFGNNEEYKELEKIADKIESISISDWKQDEHGFYTRMGASAFTCYLSGQYDESGYSDDLHVVIFKSDLEVKHYENVSGRIGTIFSKLAKKEMQDLEDAEKRTKKAARKELSDFLDK